MSNDLVQVMKRAALQVFDESSPSGIFFGKVTSISPLNIQVDQKLNLDAQHLVLTSMVSDFDVDMTIDFSTENDNYLETTHNHRSVSNNTYDVVRSESFDSTHKHDIKGKKTFKIHLGLKVDETVVLLRVQGGQKYIILDRVRG